MESRNHFFPGSLTSATVDQKSITGTEKGDQKCSHSI